MHPLRDRVCGRAVLTAPSLPVLTWPARNSPAKRRASSRCSSGTSSTGSASSTSLKRRADVSAPGASRDVNAQRRETYGSSIPGGERSAREVVACRGHLPAHPGLSNRRARPRATTLARHGTLPVPTSKECEISSRTNSKNVVSTSCVKSGLGRLAPLALNVDCCGAARWSGHCKRELWFGFRCPRTEES
jgi:hypothetical protein